MHAFGRTLRQAGDLRLLALPVGIGRERYCVAEGPTPLATFPTREQAQVFFETVRAACEEGERRRGAASGGVTDLTAYRPRGAPSAGARPPGPPMPEERARHHVPQRRLQEGRLASDGQDGPLCQDVYPEGGGMGAGPAERSA